MIMWLPLVIVIVVVILVVVVWEPGNGREKRKKMLFTFYWTPGYLDIFSSTLRKMEE